MKQKRSSEANIKIDSCQELNHLFNQLSSSSWVEISSSRTLHQLPLNVSECSLGLVLPHFCSASSKNSVLQSHNQQLLVIHYNSKIHENLTNRGINSQNVGSDYCPELVLELHTPHLVTKIKMNIYFCLNRGRKSARCLYKIALCCKFLLQF